MPAEDDGIGSSGRLRDRAPQCADTPLRGDLVCRRPLPHRHSDESRTDIGRKADGSGTERRRARRPDPALDAGLREVLVAARRPQGERNTGRHSPLYEWLWSRFDALAEELSPPRRPNWRSVADALAARIAAGDRSMLDGRGEAPDPERIRKTWWRVRKDRQAALARNRERGAAREAVPTLRAPPRMPVLAEPVPPPREATPAPETRPAHRFGTGARPKAWTPPPDSSEE